MSHANDQFEEFRSADDPWDVFELDEQSAEPEPEYGDFWGELDDDYANGS